MGCAENTPVFASICEVAVPLAVLGILLLFVYICEVAACVTDYVTGDRGIKEIDSE